LIENGIDAYAGSLADVDKNKKVDHHCRPRELVNSLLIIPARRNTIHGAGLAQICVRTAIGDPAAARRRSRLEILLWKRLMTARKEPGRCSFETAAPCKPTGVKFTL